MSQRLAQNEAREYIRKVHGENFLPEKPPKHKTTDKGAQEAHEAIRPTSVNRTPKMMKDYLTRDQYRLYQMIWQRFVASQMKAAVYDTLRVNVTGKSKAHEYRLQASGSAVKFMGFMIVYEETKGEYDVDENGDITKIPADLQEGQAQRLLNLFPEQHFTQPPPRYSEATLVKAMEENRIGRPSTYAPTLSTLQNRGYVYREERRLFPTETGIIVNDLLMDHFPNIVDIGFSARMEDDLDMIAEDQANWVNIVSEFWEPFSAQVEKANIEMPEVKAEPEYIGRACPQCGEGQLILRWGRYGKFISCDRFPECRHTEQYLEKIGVACPDCNGDLVERRTRKGRIFYGCANYPECEFTSWKKPIKTPCPHCQGLMVTMNRNNAKCLKCETVTPLDELQLEGEAAE